MLKNIWAIIRRIFFRSGEAIVDKNIVSLMEQQINDTKDKIRSSEQKLVDITASRNLVKKDIEVITKELSELESNIRQLLSRPEAERNNDLAERLAQKFAEKENQLNRLKEDLSTKEQTISKTKSAIQTTKSKLADFENRKDSVQANKALIEASASIASTTAGADSSLADLEESITRTENKQRHDLARFEAADQMDAENSGKSLEDEMIKEGLKSGGTTSSSVLERFKTSEQA